MRRILAGTTLSLAASMPGAASSIVNLPAAPDGVLPSIVMRGEPVAPAVDARPVASAPDGRDIYAVGSSLLAYGADAIPAAREEVASIDGEPKQSNEPQWLSADLPLVIRGSERGDVAAAPDAVEAETEEPAPEPAE